MGTIIRARDHILTYDVLFEPDGLFFSLLIFLIWRSHMLNYEHTFTHVILVICLKLFYDYLSFLIRVINHVETFDAYLNMMIIWMTGYMLGS